MNNVYVVLIYLGNHFERVLGVYADFEIARMIAGCYNQDSAFNAVDGEINEVAVVDEVEYHASSRA